MHLDRKCLRRSGTNSLRRSGNRCHNRGIALVFCSKRRQISISGRIQADARVRVRPGHRRIGWIRCKRYGRYSLSVMVFQIGQVRRNDRVNFIIPNRNGSLIIGRAFSYQIIALTGIINRYLEGKVVITRRIIFDRDVIQGNFLGCVIISGRNSNSFHIRKMSTLLSGTVMQRKITYLILS